MEKMLKIICTLGLISLVALGGCQKKKNDTAAKVNAVEFPDQEGWNSTVTSSKNGVVTAIIKYGHMKEFKKRKIVEFDSSVVVDFFNEKGQHTSKLTADKGKLDEATNNIEAYGNVVVVSDTGITLMTQKLSWENSIEKIISNDFVTIITADQDTFYGTGFESDQNLENWHITSFSGKASRGLNLDFQLTQKKPAADSTAGAAGTDSTQQDSTVTIK